jgi:hypothetical protein
LRLLRGLRKYRGDSLRSRHSFPVREAHGLFLHAPHKAIAIAPTAFDEPLHPPVIANGPAGQGDAAFERRITDELARPHVRAELVFGDHVVAMFEEILQHLKRLGTQPDSRALPVQSIEAGIEDTLGEGIAHMTNPPCIAGRLPAGRMPEGHEGHRISQYVKRMHEQYRRHSAAIAQVYVRFPGGK